MSWNPPPSYTSTPPAPEQAALRRRRLRRRAWWLAGTAPVVLALVVVGIRLAFMVPIASSAADDYAAGNYLDAASTYDRQKTMNLVEPWKAFYNAGTAGVASQDSAEMYDAVTSLHKAYDLAKDASPEDRCKVQTNLSLAYEITGDGDLAYSQDKAAQLEAVEDAIAARDAGEDYDESLLDADGDGQDDVDPDDLRGSATDYAQYAQQEYATAEQIRGWPDCAQSEQTPEQKEENEAAVQRLKDKQQQAKDAEPEEGDSDEQDEQGKGDEDSDGDSDDQQSQAEQEEQERQEKLDQQNSDAQDEQEELQQQYNDLYGDQSGGGGSDDGGSDTKNW